MSQDDPFFSGDEGGPTVIRPIPGGRRHRAAAPPPLPSAGAPSADWRADLGASLAQNPLAGCASGLLAAAAQLRGTAAHPNPSALLDGLVRQVRQFETCARARGMTDAVVLPARYVLCALLDESVLDTPWGSESVWGERGLLISFHNETWGGEKFFEALERLLAYPSGNLNLLELLYLCLALGFEGRYRVRDDGRNELEQVRERLFLAIRSQRGEPEQELSPHWRGFGQRRDPLIHQLPLWVLAAISGIALLGLFSLFTFALHRASDPVFAGLAQVGRDIPTPVAPREAVRLGVDTDETTASGVAPPTLRMLLAEDIATDRLEVVDRPLGQTVILRGDGLFLSGRVDVRPEFVDRLKRVGEALLQLPGQVLVTGHTDSVPIRTLRFPSNQVLSQERADNVRTLLADVMGDSARLAAEGRADTELRVPANPKDARNRRVEITLMPAASRLKGAE
ncbi:type IVB secretion system protein IcmH/DotU [Thiocapsa bogorovii]|uniref:type IVB secretion system protein IcmH/DotU n=1 Tax=Thiocapsa bogorovii TaxID=521689 RepID=UPI001E3F7B21|nr:type IVB secretion system protein IcmH/DotU [Thiocapsa bogorovii]UHD16097.1 type IVB secretion system protein IcmH/DotU [Thiocapsa bogorovii]